MKLYDAIGLAIALICAGIILALLSGCNVTSFTRPDGVRFCNTRILWATDAYEVKLGSNTASMTATKASADAAALGAVAEGVARGIIQAK